MCDNRLERSLRAICTSNRNGAHRRVRFRYWLSSGNWPTLDLSVGVEAKWLDRLLTRAAAARPVNQYDTPGRKPNRVAVPPLLPTCFERTTADAF
jgi:hypothetical protein